MQRDTEVFAHRKSHNCPTVSGKHTKKGTFEKSL